MARSSDPLELVIAFDGGGELSTPVGNVPPESGGPCGWVAQLGWLMPPDMRQATWYVRPTPPRKPAAPVALAR